MNEKDAQSYARIVRYRSDIMAILPVSSVDFNARSNVSFARKNDSEGAPADRGMTAPLGKTVPVIVLMAMNPALLNSAATMSNLQGEEENPNLITMAEPAQNFEIDDATYVMQPETARETQNSKNYILGPRRKALKVDQLKNFDDTYDIVYTSSSTFGEGAIEMIYFFENGELDYGKSGRMDALVFHNLGKEEEYCGAYIIQPIYDNKNEYVRTIAYELELPNDIAQTIINILSDGDPWENKTPIKFIETKNKYTTPAKVIKTR